MLRQISIGIRASIAFGLIGLLTLILGIFALNRIEIIDNGITTVSEKQLPVLEEISELNQEFLLVRIHSANVSSYVNDPQRLATYK